MPTLYEHYCQKMHSEMSESSEHRFLCYAIIISYNYLSSQLY